MTRDYVLKLDAGEGARAAAVDLRRQDHDLPQARRARARQLAPVLSADAAPVDRAPSRCPAATCRAADLRRVRRELAARYPALPADTCCGARAPPRHAGAARPGRRARAGRLGEHFGHTLYAARDRLSRRARNGRRTADDVLWRRTKCGLHVERRSSAPRSPPTCAHARSRRYRVSAARDAAARRDAGCDARAAMRGVLADIDDTLSTHGRITARGVRGAGAAARRGAAGHPDHRAPGGLVRPHRAHVAGRRGGRRERRVLHAPRRARGTGSRERFVVDDADAPREPRAACRDRRAHPARGARAARSPPTSPIARADLAIDYCEDVPPLAARGGRAHRRADAGRGHDGEGELDPRQRLVRPLRQAGDDADAARARTSASTSTPSASASFSSAIRRTTRRCSRSSPMRWAWPTCGSSPGASARLPAYVTERESGAGFAELAGHLLAAR